jgi:hypothetical protein
MSVSSAFGLVTICFVGLGDAVGAAAHLDALAELRQRAGKLVPDQAQG